MESLQDVVLECVLVFGFSLAFDLSDHPFIRLGRRQDLVTAQPASLIPKCRRHSRYRLVRPEISAGALRTFNPGHSRHRRRSRCHPRRWSRDESAGEMQYRATHRAGYRIGHAAQFPIRQPMRRLATSLRRRTPQSMPPPCVYALAYRSIDSCSRSVILIAHRGETNAYCSTPHHCGTTLTRRRLARHFRSGWPDRRRRVRGARLGQNGLCPAQN